MTDAEYEQFLEKAAQSHHRDVLARLNRELTPWWVIMDMHERMNDDVACHYSSTMRKEVESHPNFYSGSINDWHNYFGDNS